jgi:rare lipoprotein A (peptidoglycan hydrolase)
MLRRFRDIAPLAAVLCMGIAAPAVAQQPATGGAEATIDRPHLDVAPGAMFNRTLTIKGRTSSDDAGRRVSIQRRKADGTWYELTAATAEQDGSFRAAWRTNVPGRSTLRAVVERAGDAAATAASDPLVAQTTVFRPAVASWYGPGFFGRKTACGTKLTRKTVGVAHKELPCGTMVDVYYRGKRATVPVIDRGPFIEGRDWDLTQAAAELIGVSQTVRIGVLAPPLVALRKSPKPR